eukprot:UN07656
MILYGNMSFTDCYFDRIFNTTNKFHCELRCIGNFTGAYIYIFLCGQMCQFSFF